MRLSKHKKSQRNGKKTVRKLKGGSKRRSTMRGGLFGFGRSRKVSFNSNDTRNLQKELHELTQKKEAYQKVVDYYDNQIKLGGILKNDFSSLIGILNKIPQFKGIRTSPKTVSAIDGYTLKSINFEGIQILDTDTLKDLERKKSKLWNKIALLGIEKRKYKGGVEKIDGLIRPKQSELAAKQAELAAKQQAQQAQRPNLRPTVFTKPVEPVQKAQNILNRINRSGKITHTWIGTKQIHKNFSQQSEEVKAYIKNAQKQEKEWRDRLTELTNIKNEIEKDKTQESKGKDLLTLQSNLETLLNKLLANDNIPNLSSLNSNNADKVKADAYGFIQGLIAEVNALIAEVNSLSIGPALTASGPVRATAPRLIKDRAPAPPQSEEARAAAALAAAEQASQAIARGGPEGKPATVTRKPNIGKTRPAPLPPTDAEPTHQSWAEIQAQIATQSSTGATVPPPPLPPRRPAPALGAPPSQQLREESRVNASNSVPPGTVVYELGPGLPKAPVAPVDPIPVYAAVVAKDKRSQAPLPPPLPPLPPRIANIPKPNKSALRAPRSSHTASVVPTVVPYGRNNIQTRAEAALESHELNMQVPLENRPSLRFAKEVKVAYTTGYDPSRGIAYVPDPEKGHNQFKAVNQGWVEEDNNNLAQAQQNTINRTETRKSRLSKIITRSLGKNVNVALQVGSLPEEKGNTRAGNLSTTGNPANIAAKWSPLGDTLSNNELAIRNTQLLRNLETSSLPLTI